jgi:hypothetical protein
MAPTGIVLLLECVVWELQFSTDSSFKLLQVKPKLPWSGRRRRPRRYLLGGATLEALILMVRRVCGWHVMWLCGRGDGCRVGRLGRWMCAKATASEVM